MEKLIEHRPPLDKLSFWKRPAIPQCRNLYIASPTNSTSLIFMFVLVSLAQFDKLWLPRFQPRHCERSDCKAIIRGSMFTSSSPNHPSLVCEDCYRQHYYGKECYQKKYKHCVLRESITPEISRNICRCDKVPHHDPKTWEPVSLFPVSPKAEHIDAGGFGNLQCGLIKLGEIIAVAKSRGLQSTVGGINPTKRKAEEEEKKEKESGKTKKVKVANMKGVSLHDEKESLPTSGSTSVVSEAQADEDIPVFFRKFAKKYPFGNVHMALRVGPLVVENGVAQ